VKPHVRDDDVTQHLLVLDRLGRLEQAVPEARRYVGGAGQPGLDSGWVNYDATGLFPWLSFLRASAFVVVRGMVRDGTQGYDDPVFTLPVDYRPSSRLVFTCRSSIGSNRVDVAPTGIVSVTPEGGTLTPGSSWISLADVSFLAG
jgi:hypothetical protein